MGSADGIRYAIPADELLLPALYDGESDWIPPIKPKSLRGFDDRLQSVELASFDLAGLPQQADPAGTQPDDAASPLSKVMVEIRFWPHHMSFDPKRYFPHLLADEQKVGVLWDLDEFGANRASAQYNPSFDRNYRSRDGTIWIICSRQERMVVAPFAKLPARCTLRADDPALHAEVFALMPARYLPAWRGIVKRGFDRLRAWRSA